MARNAKTSALNAGRAGRAFGLRERGGRHGGLGVSPVARGGFGRWLARWAFRALVGFLGLTVIPVLSVRWISPPTSTVMLQHRLARVFGGNPSTPIRYRWTEWSTIPPPMRLAVVAAEDQKFPHHWGFDFESIADAVEQAGEWRRIRGASTITQQVARNLFLWQDRSVLRKGLEAYFTVLLEVLWPKRRVLEVYLNIAEFGEGIYGVSAAAQAFFGKRATEIQPREAALLAAVLPNPARLHVRNPSAYVRGRADWIEEQMRQLGGAAYLRHL